jgi:hypothetical protein
MASPTSWAEAAERALKKLGRSERMLALACGANGQARDDLFKEAAGLVRSVGEPFVAYLKAARRTIEIPAFHKFLATRICKWESFKDFREADYHEAEGVSGHGQSVDSCTTATGPGESVSMQAGLTNMIETRVSATGEVQRRVGPAIRSFEYVAGSHDPATGPMPLGIIEVPRDVRQAIIDFAGVIQQLAQTGWSP